MPPPSLHSRQRVMRLLALRGPYFRAFSAAGLQRSTSPAAFSLIEVVMALGIFTFALIAILGLLPVALLSTRESLNLATSLQLADKLNARLNASDPSSLETGVAPKIYLFNDLGEELDDSEEDKAIYKARVSLEESESDQLIRAAITVQFTGGGTPRSFCYLIFKNQ